MSTFIPLPLLQVPSSSLNSHAQLFWIFLKTGALLYGSGYVLFAFLDAELVQTGMLSKRQLIDAIAVGQFTPGPVFSSVTFIGYQLQGWEGAALSTFAIFLPAFAFVAMLNPLVKRMRNAPLFAAFLDAVNIASVAIILVTGYHLAADSIQDGKAVLIALASFGICLSFPKLNSAWVILGSALAGWLLLRI